MNLNKYTKAELISKLGSKIDTNKSKIDSNNSKIDSNDINKLKNELDKLKNNLDNSKSLSIIDIIIKFKVWILSLAIVAVLSKIFKNYKSIRAILKVANYIILTMFGFSIYEAFGFGFLVKLLGELKYIFGSIVAYLSDSTFYKFLMTKFNVAEENISIRTDYKKPNEIDWKAEFQKAEMHREKEKWKEKYEKHLDDNEKFDKKTIALLLLLLAGTITTWYYGPELLNIFSPIYNLSEVIKKVLRGGGNDDDDGNVTPTFGKIELDPDVRSISPDMLVYSTDKVVRHNVAPTLEPSDPPNAPPAPPAPPALTKESKPDSLLDAIKKGKSLKKVVTEVKDNELKGAILDDNIDIKGKGKEVITQDSSSTNLQDALLKQFNKIRPMIDSEDTIDPNIEEWEDKSGEITPTKNKTKISKFLEAIKTEQKDETSWNVPEFLKSIKEQFPNLSAKTLKNLSTPEGIKNRENIIASLPNNELGFDNIPSVHNLIDNLNPEKIEYLKQLDNIIDNKSYLNDMNKNDYMDLLAATSRVPLNNLINKFKNLPEYGNNMILEHLIEDNIDTKLFQLINDNPGTSKQQIVEKLIQESPENKDKINSVVKQTMKIQMAYLKNKFSKDELEKKRKILISRRS
jgi:hypothetical protein